MADSIWVALITGIFGIVIVWQNNQLGRRTKTNHGKTLGQHVEDLGTVLAAHTVQDAENFGEIREMLQKEIDSRP